MVEEKEKELKEKQDTISALSFTPQSKMGKMLMAKCRTLQEENEEIGNLASEGKVLQLHCIIVPVIILLSLYQFSFWPWEIFFLGFLLYLCFFYEKWRHDFVHELALRAVFRGWGLGDRWYTIRNTFTPDSIWLRRIMHKLK